MLDPQGGVSPADVHLQSFSVRYDYPAYFTRGLFDPQNPCLRNAVSGNAVSGKDPGKPQRLAIFVASAAADRPASLPALACTRAQFVAPHLEVETYTCDVLPEELRRGSRADAIARELSWVLQELR
jgi:hypothetical protein